MNAAFYTKVETCLELCGGDAERFKNYVLYVTSLTDKGFAELEMTSVAYDMLKRGESINAILDAIA